MQIGAAIELTYGLTCSKGFEGLSNPLGFSCVIYFIPIASEEKTISLIL